jgi:hypothetical protein
MDFLGGDDTGRASSSHGRGDENAVGDIESQEVRGADDTRGASSSRSTGKVKGKEKVKHDTDDDEEEEKEKEAANTREIAKLHEELEAANAAYAAAAADVENPTWGRWVKYMFVTPSGKAGIKEKAGIHTSVFHAGVVIALGSALGAVACLVPAATSSDAEQIDRTASNTTETQSLTDAGNVAFYWGTSATFGLNAINGVCVSLYSLANSYKRIREHVLEEAAAERDALRERLALREGFAKAQGAETAKYAALKRAVEVAEGGLDTARRGLAAAESGLSDVQAMNKELRAELERKNEKIKQLEAVIAKLDTYEEASEERAKALDEGAEKLGAAEEKIEGAIAQIRGQVGHKGQHSTSGD